MVNEDTTGQASRIAGRWKHNDGFSDVEFLFTMVNGDVSVTVEDTFDGEAPEVLSVAWSEDELALCFAALWSTGRLLKFRVAIGPDPDRVTATITTTHQELWERL